MSRHNLLCDNPACPYPAVHHGPQYSVCFTCQVHGWAPAPDPLQGYPSDITDLIASSTMPQEPLSPNPGYPDGPEGGSAL